ncbi:predicted protein [Nematostella vectensis]|uniref:Aerolysin-like C-terminal domain-containing protein n=1 Tax=Nematostella vectensis TaxID=45351 RepID=A7S345_NEMVE|nr:predicted protein [Nematostella vectensis]|eukprot:XP_001633963.1 predicted protein [Nematostella vectensis]
MADWWSSFDRNNRWNTCPNGYFLQGLDRNDGQSLDNIEVGKCCKPANHPHWYGHCYDQNVRASFDKEGTSKCRDGYFMTGLYRGNCDEIYCIEMFKCCKMVPTPPKMQSLDDVKTRIMDETMAELALLAHYLGYRWHRGSNRRPTFKYKFGDSSTPFYSALKKQNDRSMRPWEWHEMKARYSHAQTLINALTGESKYEFTLTGQFEDVIGHHVDIHWSTTSLKVPRGLERTLAETHFPKIKGISPKHVFPKPPAGHLSMSKPHTLLLLPNINYDAPDNNVHGNTTDPPRMFPKPSKVDISIKAPQKIPHVPNVDDESELNEHCGSNRRPTFKYKFGDSSTPFYSALKKQTDRSMRPWEWHEMKARYSHAQILINALTDESKYEFTLTGQFEDVIGHHVDIHWSTTSLKVPRGLERTLAETHFPKIKGIPPKHVFPKPPAGHLSMSKPHTLLLLPNINYDAPDNNVHGNTTDPPRMFPKPPKVDISIKEPQKNPACSQRG